MTFWTPSRITGNLNGNLIVNANSNDAGGSIDLIIEGDVQPEAHIKLADPLLLAVVGEMNGFLEVTSIYNGAISVGWLGGEVSFAKRIDGNLILSGGDGVISAQELGNGFVRLSDVGSGDPAFSGTAKFASMTEFGQLSTGKLNGTLQVSGDVGGYQSLIISCTAAGPHSRIEIGGSLYSNTPLPTIQILQAHPTAAFTVDYWGWSDGSDWDPEARVMVGETEYRGNRPSGPDRVWEVTECKGDMNNDGTINPFDMNGFVAALSSVEDYEELYPGLEGSMVYHGDMDCNGTFNTFDIQPFLDRVEDGCCSCGGCGLFMGGGGMSAEEAAGLFLEYSDASFIGNLVERIADLIESLSGAAAEYWSDVNEILDKNQ